MARIARAVAAGVPHHVTQRGNRRQPVFLAEGDYRLYRTLVAAACRQAGVAVWAYCLMPNHVHLILTPAREGGLRAALGEIRGHVPQLQSGAGGLLDACRLECPSHVRHSGIPPFGVTTGARRPRPGKSGSNVAVMRPAVIGSRETYASPCGWPQTSTWRATRSTIQTSRTPRRAYSGSLRRRSNERELSAASIRSSTSAAVGCVLIWWSARGRSSTRSGCGSLRASSEGALDREMHGPPGGSGCCELRQAIGHAGVQAADRRHVDDLPLDQLDARIERQDAGLGHAAVALDVEAMAGRGVARAWSPWPSLWSRAQA